MEQITGIEPASPTWEAGILTIEQHLHYGALDGIRTHTPKALPSEDSVSTNFTTRALKITRMSGFEPVMQESKLCTLPFGYILM